MLQSRTCAAIAGMLMLWVSLAAAPAHAGTAYAFSISPNNTLTYSFNAHAPIGTQTTPVPATSTLIGENNPMGVGNNATRTKKWVNLTTCLFYTPTSQTNELIAITSGAIDANGTSTGAPAVHPGGTFKLAIDTTALTSTLQDFNVNQVSSGTIDAVASLNNLSFQTFCTINPSCTVPGIPITISPLGTASVTALQTVQDPGVPALGTLSPGAGPGTWNFSVTTNMTVTPTVSSGGSPVAADPTSVPVTFAGVITPNGSSAAITSATAHLHYEATNDTPAPQPPTVFSIPASAGVCVGANLILSITVLSSQVITDTTAQMDSSGTKIPCQCDINNDGVITVSDIFAYLTLWFANSPQADFNGGGVAVSDIFAFLSCWFTKPLGC